MPFVFKKHIVNRPGLYIAILTWFWMMSGALVAQVVSSDPPFPTSEDRVTVTFDATQGTGGLKDYTGEVYAHTGVLTDSSRSATDWRYVKTNWGENSADTKLTRIDANTYSLDINPSVRQYYGVPEAEKITHLAFVFRSSDSQLEGKQEGGADIFIGVFEEGLKLQILQPTGSLLVQPGDSVTISSVASVASSLYLFLNDSLIYQVSGEEMDYGLTLDQPGDYRFRVEAVSDESRVADSVFVHTMDTQQTQPLPEGAIDGINYLDEERVLLVLYAPFKEHVFVMGDFNGWIPRSDSRMSRDGDRYWIILENLEPGREYAFQYLIDGTLVLADPYTEKTLDPNDRWIDPDTYPDLKPYPEGLATGITGVFQTGKDPYQWTHEGFVPPEPERLVIYELLLRDFIEAHDWKTLTDSLEYFSRLGINAIELMPVNEFEGNESWGYNPSFYFAPDKYYGPGEDLRALIDSCHGRGIAVIIDMVLNHSYSQSPLVQLYFDDATGKVTAENPWYNIESPNPVFSWGYDFDHESPSTKEFVDRVTRFWLTEYQVDGFRFDFTKGFTNTPGDGGAYDGARIEILKRMADEIWEVNPDAYVILEHLAENSEEKVLAGYGMMLWGNLNYNYNEATMGYHENGKSDFSWISYQERGWDRPQLVGYMESHDEERLMFKNLTYGNSSTSYDIQELPTALERMELAGVFFFPVPGPKMIWQFGEVGYDYSIDYDCRVCNKPILWEYMEVEERWRIYQVWSALIGLKTGEPAFQSDDYTLNLSGPGKRIEINHPDMDIRIIGNFDVDPLSMDPNFSSNGWWYDYFSGDSLLVSGDFESVSLEPGAYRIYTTSRLETPPIFEAVPDPDPGKFMVYPNPVHDFLTFTPLADEATVTLFTASGQMVMKLQLGNGTRRIDLSALQQGLYLMHYSTMEGISAVAKVMKY